VTHKPWFLLTLLGAALLPTACSDDDRPSRPGGDAGSGASTSGGKSGSSGDAGAEAEGGADSDDTGGADSGDAGRGGSAGNGGSSGSGGSLGQAGDPGEPIPPVGDPPVCLTDATWTEHSLLAISGPGDDLLQSVTHNGTTIAFKNGDTFYVADLDLDYVLQPGDHGLPFDAPKAVVGSADYTSVALGPDGLTLIALRKDLTVVELERNVGEAFDGASANAADFADLNATISTIPAANQVLTDAVLSADGESLFFSHYGSGSDSTVHEGQRSAGLWQYGNSDLGDVLLADEGARRVPTGISGDLLTPFYRDEVEGDFRAAWRINPTVPFNTSQVMSFAEGTVAAAPNGACTKVHYSAPGDNDLDLFVTYRAE
jgi:hypothetical protein